MPLPLRRNPLSPDYMGDMNPFWQTLDQVFGKYFNATTSESDSYYTTFFHPVSSPGAFERSQISAAFLPTES